MAGVTLFFVLSGYLITGTLLKEVYRVDHIDLRAFYARRALRLLPALLLVLAVCPLLLWSVGDSRLEGRLFIASVATLFYVSDFVRADGNTMVVLGHTWSLAVEEQFYLVWPLFVILLTRLRWARRRAAWIIGFITLALLSWRLIASSFYGFERVYFDPDTNAFSLILGCWLAFARPKLPRRYATGLGIGSLSIISLIAAIPVTPETPRYYDILTFGAVGVGVLAVAAVASAATSPLLAWRPLMFFGQISYGLYLWHEVLLLSIHTGSNTGQRAILAVVSVWLATGSWYLFEQPLLSKYKHRFQRPRDESSSQIIVDLNHRAIEGVSRGRHA